MARNMKTQLDFLYLRCLLLIQDPWVYPEIGAALVTLLWGIWLLLPFDTFKHSPSYGEFRAIATEVIWGCILLVIGGSHAYSLLWHSVRIRRRALFWSFSFWTFSTFVFFFYNPAGLSLVTFGPLSIYLCIQYLLSEHS